jgi:acetyltransferase-like isoleucine patch superfamily enzyme
MNLNIVNKFLKPLKNIKKTIYKKKIEKIAAKCGKNLTVNYNSYITKNTYLGENVNFNGMNIQGKGKVEIGSNFHSGKNCMIMTDIHNYDEGIAIPYDDTIISKDVIIKDNVWLGNNVIILPGNEIKEGTIIQAGSVVISNIPKYAIAGGHPAKVFKYRNKEHYEKLKKEKKFH